MSRKHEHVKVLESKIFEMKEQGKTNSEIKDYFNISTKQLKNLINRHNRRIRALEYGIVPRKKGCPRKSEIINGESKDNEIKRLRMKNKLLRDFLREFQVLCKQKKLIQDMLIVT